MSLREVYIILPLGRKIRLKGRLHFLRSGHQVGNDNMSMYILLVGLSTYSSLSILGGGC
jgi:hypothetical protein